MTMTRKFESDAAEGDGLVPIPHGKKARVSDNEKSPALEEVGVAPATNLSEEEDQGNGKACKSPRPPNPPVQPQETFPQQLMRVLEREGREGVGARLPDTGERVLEWLPSGDSFIVRDRVALERDVLPRYFNARCKYMSFVRKLYRWGFRQVDANVPGVKIFTHADFRRGEDERCRAMRSAVKKPSARQQAAPDPAAVLAAVAAAAASGQVPQQQAGSADELALRTLAARYGMDPAFLRLALVSAQQQQQQQQLMALGNAFSPFAQGGGAIPGMSFNGNPVMGMGGNGNSFSPGQLSSNPGAMFGNLSQGQGNNAMAPLLGSANVLEAKGRLDQIEQQRVLLNACNAGPGGSVAGSTAKLGGSQPPLPGAAPNASVTGAMDVGLATQLMRQNPGLEPWKALELAGQFRRS